MTNGLPPRVARYDYWENPPSEPSPRLAIWLKRIEEGWKPNRRISQMGYDDSAYFFGVYIWEYIHVIFPALTRIVL
jgi:hypothetical protein